LPATDFIVPNGNLSIDLFPLTPAERKAGDVALTKLTTHIDAWIAEAVTKTSVVAAQKAWVYYRAYDVVYVRMTTMPIEAQLDDHSTIKWNAQQLAAIGGERDAYLDTYGELGW